MFGLFKNKRVKEQKYTPESKRISEIEEQLTSCKEELKSIGSSLLTDESKLSANLVESINKNRVLQKELITYKNKCKALEEELETEKAKTDKIYLLSNKIKNNLEEPENSLRIKAKSKPTSIGENKFKEVVGKLITDKYTDYVLLNNIYLKTYNQNLTEYREIDHILVSKYGLIIIENKHWNGITQIVKKDNLNDLIKHNPSSLKLNKDHNIDYFLINSKYRSNGVNSDYSDFKEDHFTSFIFNKMYENFQIVGKHLVRADIGILPRDRKVVIVFTTDYNQDSNKLYFNDKEIVEPTNLKVNDIATHYIYTLQNIENLLETHSKGEVKYSDEQVKKIVEHLSETQKSN